jgi:hypothetical protein
VTTLAISFSPAVPTARERHGHGVRQHEDAVLGQEIGERVEHCQTRSSVVQAPLEHQKGPKEPSSYKHSL